MQSQSPADEFNRLKDCRHGKMLYNRNDIYVGRSLHEYGEFSEGEVEMFRRIVRPGDIVLDVGANIGAHTVWFAKATAPNGVVLAFEPQRIVYQTLCANIALNNLLNVIAFQQALGGATGKIFVPEHDPRQPQNFGGVSMAGHSGGFPVDMIRIDDLPLGSCRLIKVDVEGMEHDVLQGARGTIGRLRPILYIENDRGEQSDQLVALVRELEYEPFWHQPDLFNPNNFAGNRENVFGNVASFNMLCLPQGSSETHLATGLAAV